MTAILFRWILKSNRSLGNSGSQQLAVHRAINLFRKLVQQSKAECLVDRALPPEETNKKTKPQHAAEI
jgi:hypothetical protein